MCGDSSPRATARDTIAPARRSRSSQKVPMAAVISGEGPASAARVRARAAPSGVVMLAATARASARRSPRTEPVSGTGTSATRCASSASATRVGRSRQRR